MQYIYKYSGLIVVIILGLLPLMSLLSPGIPLTHDGKDHVARIANFYQSLQDGIFVPRWAGNLNWGYGHPVMMFLYPLSSYIASLFHFIGFSLSDSVKLVFVTGFVASGIAMYYWAREQFDEYTGMAAGILYMYAPYRFVDLYVRGAIGEHVAFVFPPLILFFLLKFYKEKHIDKSYLYFSLFSVSISLLILSHNAISIMYMPVILGYIAFLSYSKKNVKNAVYSLLGIVAGFGLSSFFLLPAFLEGKYTLRDIVTGDEYKTRFVDPIRFIYSKWSFGITGQFSVGLGYLFLAGLVASPLVVYKFLKSKKRDNLIIYCTALLFFLLSLFLMTTYSQFIYEIATILKKFQFPWRFLSLTVFASSVITAMSLLIIKKLAIKKAILVIGVILLLVFSKESFVTAGNYVRPDTFYEGIYEGTTDTGESSPIWSIRFMEQRPLGYSQVIEGDAVIKNINRTSTKHSYEINVKSPNVRIRENTIYFPGWNVYNGNNSLAVEYQDPSNRGLITYNLPKGIHDVEVKFEDTKVRSLSNLITITTFLLIIIGFVILRFKK